MTTGNGIKLNRHLIEELPLLIQKDITIKLPGTNNGNTVYTAKILSVDDNQLQINLPKNIDGNGYLRTSARVLVNFVLNGVLYESGADYIADNNAARILIIDSDIIKANRRLTQRLPLIIETVYTPISDLSMSSGQFSHLRWKKCQTVDFSSGGILLSTSLQADVGSYFLLNLEIDMLAGPLFVFGQVRWSAKLGYGKSGCSCGIMFITADNLHNHFSRQARTALPPIMLAFTNQKQQELGKYLTKISEKKDKGV
ncbi:MAG: PilZ domain-containing protein [candidate division Zixibacteria bacterium]